MPSPTNRPVTAIYPGSFDPVTNGHLDLIARGAMIFDKLIVAVARNLDKDPLFPVKERVEMLEAVTFDWKNVEVEIFEGLLMDYARARNASVSPQGNSRRLGLRIRTANGDDEPQDRAANRNRLHAAGRGVQLSELAAGERACQARRPGKRILCPRW